MQKLVINEKNREHFCNWFRKNVEGRNLFLRCYTRYLHSNGCSSSFIFEVPSLRVMADRIFSDMIGWKIHSFWLSLQLNECTFDFIPFSYVADGSVPSWSKTDCAQQMYEHNSL